MLHVRYDDLKAFHRPQFTTVECNKTGVDERATLVYFNDILKSAVNLA